MYLYYPLVSIALEYGDDILFTFVLPLANKILQIVCILDCCASDISMYSKLDLLLAEFQ